MSKYKFIVVSNRLPVSVKKIKGKLEIVPSPGGLATAMSSLKGDIDDYLWIGWPGIVSDNLTTADKAEITRKLTDYNCSPVHLNSEQVKLFYEGYSNETIWPLFHYFKSLAQFNNSYWNAYQQVNLLFSKVVARHSEEYAAIWVHDYHLMLMPKLLRKLLPNCSIGFFLHIPFPSFEIFRLLPNRKEILSGILGADLVGFHIYDYVSHFTGSVLRTLGYESHNGSILVENRIVRVDSFPIGIDYNKFKNAIDLPATQKEIKILDDHYKNQKIIISVDRLDYSKGITQRLEAFEQFLNKNPKQHKKVTLLVVAVPSRTEVEAYKTLKDQVEQAVSRINGAFTTADWTPISYQFKNLPLEQLVALYAKADVALVTPLRDGMNLVAKEYVACKQHRNGVLVLSELTGAVDELPEALVVNPNDTTSIVNAITTALSMPERTQRRRLNAMQRRIASYTVKRWASDFIEQLAAARHIQMKRGSKLLSKHKKEKLLSDFGAAKKRLIILDYDGTLMPFVDSPSILDAKPSKSLLALLTNITKLSNTDLCIISGRTREALEEWFGKLNVTLVAEHGFWVRQNNEWSQEETDFKSYKKPILELLEQYAERTPGSNVEEKSFSVVWHYRNVSPELAYARNASLRHDLNTILNNTEIGAFDGQKIIEIKPIGINKGVIVNEILLTNNYDFILCAGDDSTDEDMFKILPEDAYSINIGLSDTHALFQLQSISKLLALLRQMV